MDFLLKKIGIDKEKKWADLLADEREKMINTLMRDKYIISGKGPFGEEFVTSGGVKINEVNFKSMESVICPGLFFLEKFWMLMGSLVDLIFNIVGQVDGSLGWQSQS